MKGYLHHTSPYQAVLALGKHNNEKFTFNPFIIFFSFDLLRDHFLQFRGVCQDEATSGDI